MWKSNGILIQGLHQKNDIVNNFQYWGMNAYYQFPLLGIADSECRKLSDEQLHTQIAGKRHLCLEFISSFELYERYIKKCHQLQIEIRVLFIESSYQNEIWNGPQLPMEFLGYEYCPIPIDDQIITDMNWYKPFSKYWRRLNQYGLFSSFEDVNEFVMNYTREFEAGNVGDGEADNYICRVSQICLK